MSRSDFRSVKSKSKSSSKSKGERIVALDGLRGIAILCVMLHHFGYHPTVWLDWGPIAPNVFFLLSGYLITRSLFRLRNAGSPTNSAFWNQLGIFHVKRLARVLPALYVMFIIGFLWGLEEFQHGMGWHFGLLTNIRIVMLNDWVGPLSHLWSLGIQEQFYLLWPIILLLPARWMPTILIMTFFGAFAFRAWTYLIGASPLFRWFMLPASMDAFAMGGLIAWVERRNGGTLSIPTQWHYPMATIALVCWICARTLRIAVWPASQPSLALIDTLETLCIAWIFLTLISQPQGRMVRVFSNPLFVKLGQISYGLYIWHAFVHIGLGPLLENIGLGQEKAVIHYAILLIASCIVAWVSWIFLERPFIQWSRKIDFSKLFSTIRNRWQALTRRRSTQPS